MLPGDVFNQDALHSELPEHRATSASSSRTCRRRTPAGERAGRHRPDLPREGEAHRQRELRCVGGAGHGRRRLHRLRPAEPVRRVQEGSLQWQFGQYINDFSLSYTDPRIKQSNISGTVTAYHQQSRFIIRDIGQSTTQRRPGAVRLPAAELALHALLRELRRRARQLRRRRPRGDDQLQRLLPLDARPHARPRHAARHCRSRWPACTQTCRAAVERRSARRHGVVSRGYTTEMRALHARWRRSAAALGPEPMALVLGLSARRRARCSATRAVLRLAGVLAGRRAVRRIRCAATRSSRSRRTAIFPNADQFQAQRSRRSATRTTRARPSSGFASASSCTSMRSTTPATSGSGRGTSIRRGCSVVPVSGRRSSLRWVRWASISAMASTGPTRWATRIPSGRFISSSVRSSNRSSHAFHASRDSDRARARRRRWRRACAQARAVKIAYVNTPALMERRPGRAEAEALFDEGRRARISDADQEDAGFAQRDAHEVSEGRADADAAAAKDARQKSIQALETEYPGARSCSFQQQRSDAPDRSSSRRSTIVVKKVLDDIRVEDGYCDDPRQRSEARRSCRRTRTSTSPIASSRACERRRRRRSRPATAPAPKPGAPRRSGWRHASAAKPPTQ